MIDFKKDRIIDPIPRRETIQSHHALRELALKYYDTLEPIVNDLAQKCLSGEETSLSFPMGKVIIKLK